MTLKTVVVEKLLASLRRYLTQARSVQAIPLGELTADWVRWNGVLHILQLCVEHVVDIGNHLLAARDVVSDSNRETILMLGRLGIVPLDFANRIVPMTGFRNVVVHEYLTVDPAIVERVLKYGLDDFEQYIEFIYDYLRREGHLPTDTQ
jgi:uncharacterized protein YutE (UPF0331/DUF86 family)